MFYRNKKLSCILHHASYIVIFILTILAFTAYAQDFTINKFHADISINEDSSFAVKEIIDVEFHKLKHGIYREIPFKYTDERGNRIKTPLEVLSVTDESGNEWKYKTKKTGNVINIRIGDPKKYVEGHQKYVITYRVVNAILFFDDHDELYWNVTGNYWWAPIKEASANITLTVKKKSENLWAACYTGTLGSKESQCSFETSTNNGEFFTKKNLNSREGFYHSIWLGQRAYLSTIFLGKVLVDNRYKGELGFSSTVFLSGIHDKSLECKRERPESERGCYSHV